MGESINLFTSGALAAGYAVIAVFFGRFWKDTHDRLFGAFAAAFVILAFQRIALSLVGSRVELEPALYGLRLLAFLIIIGGIVDKNRSRGVAA